MRRAALGKLRGCSEFSRRHRCARGESDGLSFEPVKPPEAFLSDHWLMMIRRWTNRSPSSQRHSESTNPGKGTTKAGKQSAWSERQVNRISTIKQ